MIRKQYRRGVPGYFRNFIHSHDPEDSIDEKLKSYKATIAKSKSRNRIMNVKWHDPDLYLLFVLRWS